jgi:hypothetical protein
MGSAQIQGAPWRARARAWADLQEGSFRLLYETGRRVSMSRLGSTRFNLQLTLCMLWPRQSASPSPRVT